MNGLDEKIHPPTPRRREEARTRGDVARSADLTAAIVLLAGILSLEAFGKGLFDALASQLKTSLERLHEFPASEAPAALASLAGAMAIPMAPVLLAALLAAVSAGVAQTGFLFTAEPLAPRAERLTPHVGRLFSGTNALAGLFKAGALLAVLALTLWNESPEFLRAADPIRAIGALAFKLSIRAALALLVLGFIDYGVRRWKHELALRMTPQEMREEMRRYEGDPQVRERRRSVQRRLAMERMIHRVPRSRVVLTSPDGPAVAIEYDPGTTDVPVVAAKGRGEVARKIVELAHESGIAVVENPAAAELYRRSDVGAPVPAEQYRQVADAVAFAMAAANRMVQA